MICLRSNYAVDWFSPVPTHFRHPVGQLAEALADWIEDMNVHNDFTLYTSLLGEWEEGATIAPVVEQGE